VIGVIVVLILALLLVATLAIWLWMTVSQSYWQRRAEQARVDREVRRAERRLHNLASSAFSSMLTAARGKSSGRQ
jgi:hypothetical protein